VCLCVLLALCSFGGALQTRAQTPSPDAAKGDDDMNARQLGRVRAPELSGGRGWLNTDKPLSMTALRGKVVLLDFWTYGCINCMHIIPDLKRLEEKYARQLVVVGVHSAKFDNEKETENIRRVVLRYGIEHPVVNDADFQIWQAYAVRAWPTQVLVDPAGYVIGRAEGEGNYDALDKVIAETVEDFRKRGALDEQPLNLALERAKVGDLPLAFPGKLLADERGDRLFIADSNHNRVVITKLDGTLLETIGTGERGSGDGAYERASFAQPQGLALDADALYVADTGNHLIRRVDLKARTVGTIAGTGEQLRDYRVRGGAARTTAISSPWDLQLVGRTLYVAMAGPHQIWKLDLDTQQLAVFAGTGREARADGAREEAAFAQPSGLATDGRTLYVADSESNIIRAVRLAEASAKEEAPQKETSSQKEAAPTSIAETATIKAASASAVEDDVEEVRTLAGGDLFEFGDVDGEGDDVRLQHPLGLVFYEGKLFIADTYNHKIKQLDPRTRVVKTFAGTGKPGQTDGANASFYEPAGLAVANGKLYIADTNNHAVRVLDLANKQSKTLLIRGLQPPAQGASASTVERDAATSSGLNAEETKLAPQRVRTGKGAGLTLDVKLPEGYHLNPAAPNRYEISTSGGDALSLAEPGQTKLARTAKDLQLPLRLPLLAARPGASELRVRLTLYYCREDNTGTCRIKMLAWRVPVEAADDAKAPAEIKVQGEIKE
jgi:sugar lactone lactonase YvrE